ncbi:MAG: hypothetical protein ACRDXB_16715 [Actinomycetes bacterium]
MTVSMRVAPRAAACFSVPRIRREGRYAPSGRLCLLTVTAARSDVLPRDDILADRRDAIYRDNPESRVREVVA